MRDHNQAITRWLGTCTDIDERKRTEDQLRASAVMLVQSNRELEDFATVASHDLQEPLRKIRSFVGCLRDEASDALNAEGRTYLDRIQNAAKRMTTLVEDLLEFSRISARGTPFVQVDLNEVIAGVVSDLDARLAETGGHLDIQTLPTVRGDPTQMRQLLQNLIGNALKFHRADAAPVVRISAEIIDNPIANARGEAGRTCRISVADNGIGFDEKYLDRVFTIFQRLHGRGDYEGTGIGLAVCRRIVERHGGSIGARSKPGTGSTFIVTMPLETEPMAANIRPAIILLADDDSDDREMSRRAFEKNQLANELYTVTDGEELMDYLYHRGRFAPPAASPTPGLILLDLNMPKKDGREALAEIKADPMLRRIPIVVLTTSKAQRDVASAYDLGSSSYIIKPVSFATLVEATRVLALYWFQIVTLPERNDSV